ncbi:MAG: DUF1858 domain-containing protein [Culicoidibacterales bacterium]
MMIEIRLDTTIYELTETYPEIIDIMSQIGFTDVTRPVVRKTAGKVMTLEKGIQMQKKDKMEVIEHFRKYNFELR